MAASLRAISRLNELAC